MERQLLALVRLASRRGCYQLGEKDPVVQKIPHLLSRVGHKRTVRDDPTDPLQVAKRRMEYFGTKYAWNPYYIREKLV